MDMFEFQLEFTYHENATIFAHAAEAAKEMVDRWPDYANPDATVMEDIFLASWESEYVDNYEEDIVELSKHFPMVVFEITCLGNVHSTWKEYVKSGMVQISQVVVSYDDFDESKLRPFEE